MTWATRPSLPGGHEVTASEVDAILDQIEDATSPPFWKLDATATSVSTATDARLTFSTNVGSSGVTVTSLRTIAIIKPGRYEVRFTCRWNAGGTGGAEIYGNIRRYDSGAVGQEGCANGGGSHSGGGGDTCAKGSMICAAGDLLEAWVYQASGGSKTPAGSPFGFPGGTMFEGYWVGDA